MLSKHLRKLSSLSLQVQKGSSFTQSFSKATESYKIRLVNPFSSHTKNLMSPRSNSKSTDHINNPLTDSHTNESLIQIQQYFQQNFSLRLNLENDSQTQFHQKHKNFITDCEKFGISFKEAKHYLSFIRAIGLVPPSSTVSEDFPILLKNLKLASEQYKDHHLEFLRDELRSLEKELEPVKSKYFAAKDKTQRNVDRKYRLGMAATISQMVGLYCGAYVYLGLQQALLGLGTFSALAGSGVYCSKKVYSGRSIKEIMFRSNFERIAREDKVDFDKLGEIQNEIDFVREELIELIR